MSGGQGSCQLRGRAFQEGGAAGISPKRKKTVGVSRDAPSLTQLQPGKPGETEGRQHWSGKLRPHVEVETLFIAYPM